jgi:hypothetical protein
VRSAAGLAVRLGRPPGAVHRRSADSDVRPDVGTSERARTTSFGRDFPERRPM